MSREIFDTTEVSRGSDDFVEGDVVRLYTEGTELEFPCLVLSCEQLEKYKVDAMKGLLMGNSPNGYNVYIHFSGASVAVGRVGEDKLRVFLDDPTFASFEKVVHLDKNSTYQGDLLYALCPAT